MDKVTSYIKECETEFMQLLGLTSFPIYEIAYKDISLSVSDEQGYDSLGSAHYDYKTGKHTLTVWSNIHTLGEVGKQTIFHEFTHILDDETYVNKDPEKYIANHGYTEYHAAQIGFLKVLGVKSIKQNISFSMSDFIDTESGYMSIQDYVDAPLLLANELIGHANFPTEFKVLKDTMGVIFNYFVSQKELDNADALISSIVIFQSRGSITATQGHIPETILRKYMTDWGLNAGTDFNTQDVEVGEILGDLPVDNKIKKRKYDFIVPFQSRRLGAKVFIQSQFYAGDSGSVSHKVVDQTDSTREVIFQESLIGSLKTFLKTLCLQILLPYSMQTSADQRISVVAELMLCKSNRMK